MIKLICGDNNSHPFLFAEANSVAVIYADMIYDDLDFRWVYKAIDALSAEGVLIVQTDYHSVAELKIILDKRMNFLNWCIYKQEWGGTSKRFFPRKHDDILIYARGNEWKFYPDRIQIAKKTAGTAFDVKGTGLKTPCDVFDDLGNFSTMSSERVKGLDGKNIQWQKPLKLMDRLLLPFTDEGDLVLDPFMGSNTTGLWCKMNNRNFIGIEKDPAIFKIAEERVK